MCNKIKIIILISFLNILIHLLALLAFYSTKLFIHFYSYFLTTLFATLACCSLILLCACCYKYCCSNMLLRSKCWRVLSTGCVKMLHSLRLFMYVWMPVFVWYCARVRVCVGRLGIRRILCTHNVSSQSSAELAAAQFTRNGKNVLCSPIAEIQAALVCVGACDCLSV